jgi:ATP-binding protein involved in chromosome partitioning
MSRDPRILKAVQNLRKLRRVYAVISSKGGVGKTTVSTLLALYTSNLHCPTGLIDLDFVNPSTHVILGLKPEEVKYVEEKGILPYRAHVNLYYFTIVSYTRDRSMALRGLSARNALWEVLSIIDWRDVSVLYIDTPPGIGDEHLDLLYDLKEVLKPIVVTTPNLLSMHSAEKIIEILKELGYNEIYLIENMGHGSLLDYAGKHGLIYLGYIPFSNNMESVVGEISRLFNLDVRTHVEEIAWKLLKSNQMNY